LLDAARITVNGSAGWGVGESKLGGDIVVEGGAGNGAGAAMRGGTLVVKGTASARAGVSIKGGTLVIGGNCGYMTGFMGQKGTIIVCGDAGEALADSMYETEIFVGGSVDDLGNDAVIQEPTADDLVMLASTCEAHGIGPRGEWKKVVSGREMWNFKKDSSAWREVL
jgi:glutamate synthase domain-containing protein 3